jgi:uncharacterized membrane protein YgcG
MDFDKIIADAKASIDADDLTSFKEQVTKAVTAMGGDTDEKYNLQALAAALLKLTGDAKDQLEKVSSERPSYSQQADSDPNSTIQRFFINVGMADDLDEESLKKFVLDNVTSVKAEDFTDVYLKDTFSFFELPKTAIDDVMKNLMGKKVGDREVRVELSEKKKSGGRGGFGGGNRGGYGHGGGYGRNSGGRGYGHDNYHGGYSYDRNSDRDRGGYSRDYDFRRSGRD